MVPTFSNNETLTRFMVARARQQGMAGKILFPIPNRQVLRSGRTG